MVQPIICYSFTFNPGPLLKGQGAQTEGMLRGLKGASKSLPIPAPQLGHLLPLQDTFSRLSAMLALVQRNVKPGLGGIAAQDSTRPRLVPRSGLESAAMQVLRQGSQLLRHITTCCTNELHLLQSRGMIAVHTMPVAPQPALFTP